MERGNDMADHDIFIDFPTPGQVAEARRLKLHGDFVVLHQRVLDELSRTPTTPGCYRVEITSGTSGEVVERVRTMLADRGWQTVLRTGTQSEKYLDITSP